MDLALVRSPPAVTEQLLFSMTVFFYFFFKCNTISSDIFYYSRKTQVSHSLMKLLGLFKATVDSSEGTACSIIKCFLALWCL